LTALVYSPEVLTRRRLPEKSSMITVIPTLRMAMATTTSIRVNPVVLFIFGDSNP
jgi:hypothetical protein